MGMGGCIVSVWIKPGLIDRLKRPVMTSCFVFALAGFVLAPNATRAQTLQQSFLTAGQLIAAGGATSSSCVEFPASSGMFFVAVAFSGSDTFVSTTPCDPATFVSTVGGTGSGLAADLGNTEDFLLNGFQNFQNVLGAVQAHLDKTVVPGDGVDGDFPDLQPGQVDDPALQNDGQPVGIFDKAKRIVALKEEIAALEQKLQAVKRANEEDEAERREFIQDNNHPLKVKIRDLQAEVNRRINEDIGNDDHTTPEHFRAEDRLRDTDPEFAKLYDALEDLFVERRIFLDRETDEDIVRDLQVEINTKKNELNRLLGGEQANSKYRPAGTTFGPSEQTELAYRKATKTPVNSALTPLLSQSNTQGFLLDLDALFRGDQSDGSTRSPWDFWLQGSLTVFDDNQAADRDGQFLQFIGGTSYRVNPRLTVGGLVTYNNGSTTSNALASSLSSNFLGAGLFARVDVYEGVLLDTVINYQHGWNEVTISGASGEFGSDSIDIAAGLSRRYYFQPDWWLEPNASLSYSNIRRSAYTNSSGAAIASSNVEQGRFTFGPKIGHIFAPASGPLTQGEVFVGLNGIVDFISNGDSAVGNGLVANDPGSGVQVSGGLNMTFDNGWDASASGTYMSVGTLDSFTASINLRIPLN